LKLWSIQRVARWERLQRDGKLRAHSVDPDHHYPGAYRFMRNTLVERVGAPPEESCWPIWAWYHCDGADKPRPDLRCSAHLPPGERGVRIELEIPNDRVLLSDFDTWGAVIIGAAVLDGEAEVDRFWKECEQAGLPNGWLMTWEDTDKVLAHPVFGERLRCSWNRVFDLDWYNDYWNDPPGKKSIQAVFWEIRREDVRKVDFFTGR